MTAYLQPGDQIHLVYPSTGDPARDDQTLADLRQAYQHLGVNIAIGTAVGQFKQDGSPVGSSLQPQVLAVFRANPVEPYKWVHPS